MTCAELFDITRQKPYSETLTDHGIKFAFHETTLKALVGIFKTGKLMDFNEIPLELRPQTSKTGTTGVYMWLTPKDVYRQSADIRSFMKYKAARSFEPEHYVVPVELQGKRPLFVAVGTVEFTKAYLVFDTRVFDNRHFSINGSGMQDYGVMDASSFSSRGGKSLELFLQTRRPGEVKFGESVPLENLVRVAVYPGQKKILIDQLASLGIHDLSGRSLQDIIVEPEMVNSAAPILYKANGQTHMLVYEEPLQGS